MDTDDDISSFKRQSTLELSSKETSGNTKKSSRVHAIASVKATSKLTQSSKSSLTGMQKGMSNERKSLSSQKSVGCISQSLSHTLSLLRTSSASSRLSLMKNSSRTNMLKELSSKNKLKRSKKLWYLKGVHVAVLVEDGTQFFLCRLEQNVYNNTKEVKVRWLSQTDIGLHPNIFRTSYLDRIDPVSILLEVKLSQKSRLQYLLPADQQEEIEKRVGLVKDIQSGKISLQDIDDEDVEEVVQIEEPPKKKPKLMKTSSQHIRDKAKKIASKMSKSKASPKTKKTSVKQPKEKERKRKLSKKEKELVLRPRPEIKVLDKDPLFESREPMPYISKVSNSKLIFRAINLGDTRMLKKLLKDGHRIKQLYGKSVDHKISPLEALARAPNKEILTVLLEEYVEDKFTMRLENNLDDKMHLNRLDTGSYNQKSLGVSHILKIQASRGSKEGNNAFTANEWVPCCNSWDSAVYTLTQQGLPASTLEAFEVHVKKVKPKIDMSLDGDIVTFLLRGQNKLAGKILKKNSNMCNHNEAIKLLQNVLLFEKEEIKQCPPSAVKQYHMSLHNITAIHGAAVNPNSKYLQKLLQVVPNAHVTDSYGCKPIHYAACCSSPDNIELLLTWRVSTSDTSTNLNIPLHYAILARRPENVEALLKHDKKDSSSDPSFARYGIGGVNRPMKNSLNPLHMAAELEEVAIARILISYDASVNAKTSVNNLQRSPLQIAAQTGNLEMVKLLVKHGAVVEQKDRLGRTALVLACKNGATKVLSYLLHIGANAERCDSSGNSPLHYAAAYGWYFTVKMLLDVGVDPNAINMWKISPLSVASMKGHVGILRQLFIHSKINIKQTLSDGITLLFHACESDLTQDDLYKQIQYLIKERGALCDIKDNTGKTALFHLACATMDDPDKKKEGQAQCIKIAQLLLDNGCDLHGVDERGFNALMEVLGRVTNCDLAEFLIEKGSGISAPNTTKRTTSLLHAINDNFQKAGTSLHKVINILSRPKFIKDVKEMAKCYDKDGYNPLLHLCSTIDPMDDNVTHLTENEKDLPLPAYVKFLVETLDSQVNVVVKEKYFPPGSILPKEDSADWFFNSKHAKSTPLMLLLEKRDSDNETSFGTEEEEPVLKVIRYLIDQGSDLNVVNGNGCTPLSYCITGGCVKLIRFVGEHESCSVNQVGISRCPAEYTDHPLHLTTDINQIDALLDIGCDPSVLSKEKQYTTFLHTLIQKSERTETLMIVDKLAENQSRPGCSYDFNTQDWKGKTVLHHSAAVNPGQLDTSLELEYNIIQNGGKVGLQDKKGRTPLHYVFKPKIQNGRPSDIDATHLTKILSISMTVKEINAKDYNGKTALHLAAEMGATISCSFLLSLGDSKADISLYDKDGNTALTLAVLNGHDVCAASLMQLGANPKDAVVELSEDEKIFRKDQRKLAAGLAEQKEQGENDDVASVTWTLDAEKHLEKEVRETRTPLYKAAMKKCLQGVIMILTESDEITSLDMVKMAFEASHYNIAMDILCNQWNPTLHQIVDKDGRNLLHLLAVSCKNNEEPNNSLIFKAAHYLIKKDVPLEHADNSGLFPIHWAIINRHFDLADFLAEHGTPYDKDPNGRGFSYLESALWRIYSKEFDDETWCYLEKLSKNGMDINKYIKLPLYPDLTKGYLKGTWKDPELEERTSTCNTTALITAIRCTSFSSKQASNLLKSGARSNLADGNQITPMMHAVIQNDKEFVKLLLNHDYPNITDNPAKTIIIKEEKLNTSIFRLKPDSDEESESDYDSSEDEEKEESHTEELKPMEKTSDINLDAKDKSGRTALHYVASPLPEGTFDNADIAFLLVKAGAKEMKDKLGLTPYALAVKTGAVNVADMLKSLGHGKNEKCQIQYKRDFHVNDGICFKDRSKPDFLNDAEKVLKTLNSGMEVDRSYVHRVDNSCSVQNGTLLKDKVQDVWYDVLLTRVDVKHQRCVIYNFYKIQLVHQPNPSLYTLFTSWGCIGETGQYQHTPFSDLDNAVKEFAKIFQEKTGNKWEDVKNFQIKRKKYRLLDDKDRLAPAKLDAIEINIESEKNSNLPDHLLLLLQKMMNPKALVAAMERIEHLNLESLPFGQLKRERLVKGKQLLEEIRDILENCEFGHLRDDNESKRFETYQKIEELSNEYFHVIPQKNFSHEDIGPFLYTHVAESHLEAVEDLLDYEVACKMLLGAMASKHKIHPADYVYRSLDCLMELMQPDDPMAQLLLKYIYLNGDINYKIISIYKISRYGEDARLNDTKMENRRLLFHGTNANNMLSILSRGLMMQHPLHGTALGRGIYFSDCFEKSRSYAGGSGFVLVCEVSLGKTHSFYEVTSYDDLDKISNDGYDSLIRNYKGKNENNWLKLSSGVSINLENKYQPPNEYVIKNPAQACIRYLVQFK